MINSEVHQEFDEVKRFLSKQKKSHRNDKSDINNQDDYKTVWNLPMCIVNDNDTIGLEEAVTQSSKRFLGVRCIR